MSNPQATPKHVAIIMDGNGRWAERRHLPRVAGHEEGIKAIERTIKVASENHVNILTLFAFGIENWKRPAEEVAFLMRLFTTNLHNQAEHFKKNNIQFRVVGDSIGVDPELQKKIIEVQELTASNSGLILIIAFNYSGRWDILQASRKLAQHVQAGQLRPQDISYQTMREVLCLGDLPEPDLFIRTSGEQRISNFLLWQLAYTELYFTEVLWPDFNEQTFHEAIYQFSRRQRRYGLTGQQVQLF